MFKKIYREFFYVPKYGKVREKVLMARLSVSAMIMVLCVAAMSFSAYAYFTSSVTSAVKPLQSAQYTLDVVAPDGLTPTVENDTEYYILDNSTGTEAKVFTFDLVKAKDASASVGFCKVQLQTDVDTEGTSQIFYTQPIGTYAQKDADGIVIEGKAPITDDDCLVRITVERGKTAKVWFTPEWGSCAADQIVDEEAGIVPVYGELPPLPEPPAASTVDQDEPEDTSEPTQPTVPVKGESGATEPTVPTETEPEVTQTTTPAETEPETIETTTPAETTAPAESEPETAETTAPAEPAAASQEEDPTAETQE